MEQATLQFARTGRAEPRPDTPNGLVVFLAAFLILVVGTATVTVRHAARNGVPAAPTT